VGGLSGDWSDLAFFAREAVESYYELHEESESGLSIYKLRMVRGVGFEPTKAYATAGKLTRIDGFGLGLFFGCHRPASK
jgi:hypothetical protein